MKRILSIIIILCFILSLKTNVFAESDYTETENNENLCEYDVENMDNNTITNDHCSNCRAPNLTIEAQEELKQLDPSLATYTNVSSPFLDTYAAHYFIQLKDYIPNNFEGSCSYVAATMLLSYYDTYWDDNIIDENYEAKSVFNYDLSVVKSPSTKTTNDAEIIDTTKEKFGNKNTYTDAEYYEALISFAETDLQRKLIKIAVEEHIDGIFEYFSLFPHEVKLLLEHYLYTDRNLSSSQVSVELVLPGTTDIKEYAIEKVKLGIPVFVSAAASLTSAHSFIIYDYDEVNDELYCHMGWGANTTHVAFSTIEYQVFEGAVSLSFNTDHSHSNNYRTSDDTTYCSCYFSCHPEHICTYSPIENYNHIYTCGCVNKSVNTAAHEYEYVRVDNEEHRMTCVDCGYSEVFGHVADPSYMDPTGRFAQCRYCGTLYRIIGLTPIIKNKIPEEITIE